MCPFCYIGKRKFETALSRFKEATHIQIIWKSFQLSPAHKTSADKNVYRFFAEYRGVSMEQARRMHDHVTALAEQEGLVYNFDKAVPANTFNAHRFSHFAKDHGLQNIAEEILFKAYFTEGRNIDDLDTLVELGEEIGLDAAETKSVLSGNRYEAEVKQDIYEARQAGVVGVPFFVLGGKYVVSGAQDSQAFLETLEKAFAEWSPG